MGYLQSAIAGGLPAGLVLSIIPPHALENKEDKRKKAPGLYNEKQQIWYTPQGWQHGISSFDRDLADRMGGGAGLLTGVATDGQQYLLLDLDVELMDEPDAESRAIGVYAVVEDAVVKAFQGRSFWVRKTHPWRGMVAVRIDPTVEAGRKSIVNLYFKEETKPRVKLELLANGQQGQVAGLHPEAGKIHWHPVGKPHQEYERLDVSDQSVPFFENREIVETILEQIVFILEGHKLNPFVEVGGKLRPGWVSRGGVGSRAYGTEFTPMTMAPLAGASRVVNFLNKIRNGKDVDRAVWQRMGKAIGGTRRALLAQGRLTPEEELAIREAFINWALRWGGKTSYAEELTKWNDDWINGDHRTGWHHALDLAETHLGEVGLVSEEAAWEFATVDLPKGSDGLPAAEAGAAGIVNFARDRAGLNQPSPFRKRDPGVIDIKTSDLQIADAVAKVLDGHIMWVAEEKRWLLWEHTHWSYRTASLKIQTYIANEIAFYTREHGAQWTNGQSDKVLSQARFKAINEILRSRFFISAEALDQSAYVLQTPDGACDLKTGGIYSGNQQMLLDTRITQVAPKPGETPLFDGLLYNLCDGKSETREWLMSFLGYAAIGFPSEHVFTFLWGPGGNGKSLLLKILAHIFGDYATFIDRDLLLSAGREKHLTFLYDLKGKRFAFVSEMPANEKWNEARLKSLTGLDKQRANRMHGDSVEFKPECAFLMCGQYLPVFNKVDESVARRVRVIGTHIRPAVEDSMLEDKIITQEGPAILTKLIDYARKVYENNMRLPEVPAGMKREISKYLDSQDAFYGWFRDECYTCAPLESSEIPLRALRHRHDSYMKRKREREEEGDEDSDIDLLNDMTDKKFLYNLRRLGAVLEDDHGHRFRTKIGTDVVPMVRGIAFKLSVIEDAFEPAKESA
jgi:P4 family phage/plasmid primase-like protien